MTDNMVIMWRDLMGSMIHSVDENLVQFALFDDYSVITPESFIEHMLFEFCKHSYYKRLPKYPLRHFIHYDNTENSERMLYSRILKYEQKYKDFNYSILRKYSDNDNYGEELRAKSMESMKSRKEGYELSEMDFFEATTVHDLEIVKSISECRLYSSKKVSNDHFMEIFEEYDRWVQELIDRSKKSDEDMIFASVAFFTFEWKYAIEYYYYLAEYMVENNINTVDFWLIYLFTGSFRFESMLGIEVETDSRMIKDRIELIPLYYEKNIDELTIEYLKRVFIEVLTIKSLMITLPCTEGGQYIDWFCDNVTTEDMASFFRDYDVFQIWQKKKFDNKKIMKLRTVLESSSTFRINKSQFPDFRA